MFSKTTLKLTMIFFTIFSIIIIFTFSNFMNNSIYSIGDSIKIYKEKAVKGKLLVVSIEKDLNYISRCSRDIMLGNNYKINMNKIQKRIETIHKNFSLLEETLIETSSKNDKHKLVENSKYSTLDFINGVYNKMTLLENSDAAKRSKVYDEYKKQLTPLAIESRNYFSQIQAMKEEGFIKITYKLNESINKEKKFVIISTLVLTFLAISLMSIIYIILKKQFKTQDNLNNINSMLSQYVIYSKTDLKGIITEASDAFCEISMYSRDELIGQPHNIIRHPQMESSDFKNIWDTIKAGDTWEGEVQNLKKDGTNYWVMSHISPEKNDAGKITGYVAIRYDITSKKNYEQQNEQLIQSEKMASLGMMIGNIAHQWRQPLSAISSTASSIKVQAEFGILDINDISAHMETITYKTNYLSDTINTFRDFIKGEKILKELVLQGEIKQALAIAQASIEDNNIFLLNNIDQVDDIKITMISGELPQVLINIINNARDILVENKTENPTIDLKLEVNNNMAVISIEDNAGGIPKDVMPQIFEPYFTTKHQSQGTGLGLHMSYQIINESLNGKLYATNTNKGAKFFIELPLS